MPQGSDRNPIASFFGGEWDRFWRGLERLNPEYWSTYEAYRLGYSRLPSNPGSINIPGWDDVIKLGPRYQPTRAEWAEFYRARREGRVADISGQAAGEISRALDRSGAMRDSAQPGWSRAWGEIMTALDNIQDFASTLATAGRLGLWGAEWLLNLAAPGMSADAASAAAAAAAQAAARDMAAELATLGIRDIAFTEAFARAAYAQVLKRGLMGLGTRLAVRAIPVVGWIVTVVDMLNLFNLWGTILAPAYAFLCKGPTAAVVAGIPGFLTKNVICRRTWTMVALNPLSREARAIAKLKAAGRLPNISNLIEAAQTTDNLFGWGLSIGGIYGAVMDTLFTLAGEGAGTAVPSPAPANIQSIQNDGVRVFNEMPGVQQDVLKSAARALQGAALVQSANDVLEEYEHFIAQAAALGAMSVLQSYMDQFDAPELLAWQLGELQPMRQFRSERLLAMMEPIPPEERGFGYWPIPGNPRAAYGEELVSYLGPAIARSWRTFAEPRRVSVDQAFYGAMTTQLTENLWRLLEGHGQAFKYELTTDYKLMTGMAVDGLLVPYHADHGAAWGFWVDARAAVEEKGGKLLSADEVKAIAKRHHLDLVQILSPDEPLPAEWIPWLIEQREVLAREL